MAGIPLAFLANQPVTVITAPAKPWLRVFQRPGGDVTVGSLTAHAGR
jgi:hypothetical protein